MNRTDFHKLAVVRIKEAVALYDNKYYEGAYYLAGYAVESAFKACISKQIRKHDFPDRKFVVDSYTHDLNKLLGLCGLKEALKKRSKEDVDFALNWQIVKDWSEQDRYKTKIEDQKAKDMIDAICNEKRGILSWLKNWW